MKAIIIDEITNHENFQDYDYIFTYFPVKNNSKRIKYLFSQDSKLDDAIIFKELFFKGYLNNKDDDLLTSSLISIFDSVFIDNFSIEFISLKNLINKYNITSLDLSSKNYNKKIYESICKSKNLHSKVLIGSSSIKDSIQNFFIIIISIFISYMYLLKTFFSQFLVKIIFSDAKSNNANNTTIIASARNSDFRQLKNLKKKNRKLHFFLVPKGYSSNLKSYVKKLDSNNYTYGFQKMTIITLFKIIFHIPFTVRKTYDNLSLNKNINKQFYKQSLLDFLSENSKLFIFSSFISLYLISKYSFKDNQNHFSKNNIFLLSPGVGTNILNKLLIIEGKKTFHLQHGMILEPYSYKFNVSENMLYSANDVAIMNKICNKSVINSIFNFQSNISTYKSKKSKEKIDLGVLSTTFYYSSNFFISKDLELKDIKYQNFFNEMITEIKKENSINKINFKFHPNQKANKKHNFVDLYYDNLDDIYENSDLIITPMSSTILELIQNRKPFLVYNSGLYFSDSFSNFLPSEFIFNDFDSFAKCLKYFQNKRQEFQEKQFLCLKTLNNLIKQ